MIPEIIVPSTEEIAEFRRIFFEKLEQQKGKKNRLNRISNSLYNDFFYMDR